MAHPPDDDPEVRGVSRRTFLKTAGVGAAATSLLPGEASPAAPEILGPDAALADDNAPYGGYWQYQQLRSRGNTIEAGTSEVLRNIVAERVLGLPKSR